MTYLKALEPEKKNNAAKKANIRSSMVFALAMVSFDSKIQYYNNESGYDTTCSRNDELFEWYFSESLSPNLNELTLLTIPPS